MHITPLYTAEAVSTGEGRNGHVRSNDGLLDFDVSIPHEMGGMGGATNPEQLFAAGYAACFHSALRGSAQKARITLREDTSVTARVSIGPREGGGYGLQVALVVQLPGLQQEDAIRLVEQAHQACPYSNATRGNVEVTLFTLV